MNSIPLSMANTTLLRHSRRADGFTVGSKEVRFVFSSLIVTHYYPMSS